MKVLRYIVIAVASCLAAMHAPLAAQTARTAALDATIGAGVGHGGDFFDRQLLGARLAASLRWSRPTRFALFGEVAIDALSLSSGHYAVCYLNPPGGCLDAYPQLIGATITAGLLAPRLPDRFEMRLGLGGGVYRTDNTQVAAPVGQADVAWFPTAHLGLVVGGRAIIVPRYHGDLLATFPWAIGLRLR